MWSWAEPAFPRSAPQRIRGLCRSLAPPAHLRPTWLPAQVPLWESMCSLEPLTASAVLVLPASQPLAFWLRTAGQVLNESGRPHKAGASAPDSYPLPCLPTGWVMVQIQSLGFRFGSAKYQLCHRAQATYPLWPRSLVL